MLDHYGTRIVGAEDAPSERTDVRAERAIHMLNIGRGIASERQHCSLGGNYSGQHRCSPKKGGRGIAYELM